MFHVSRRRVLAALAAFMVLGTAGPSFAAEPVRVLIVDGQNNHDYEATTPWLKRQLEAAGRFVVETSRTPAALPRLKPGQQHPPDVLAQQQAAWASWRPDFAKHHVVLINYNGEPWPGEVNAAFEKFASGGGGVFVLHAGNNAFPDWPAYNQMIGLGWRAASFGKRLVFDPARGKAVLIPAGEGPGAGHGAQHAYQVQVRDASHPVMAGLPPIWMHARDELYHGQRGPAENMHVLATAYSDPTGPGGDKSTGAHEPLVWWVPFGKGRVFTCLLGHVGRAKPGEPTVLDSQRDTAFLAILTRGCEWAATGKVTIPLPAKLPTASEVELAPVDLKQ